MGNEMGEQRDVATPVEVRKLNRAGRLAHIDALRAFAVILVVLMHSGISRIPGDGGVTVFFCISGYIISSLLFREHARDGGFDAKGFYWRRFLKLAPPLVLFILLPTVVYGFFHNVSALGFGSQIFFTFNWVQVFDPSAATATIPGSSVVWSLAVEEQFYIVFAIFWAAYSIRARNYTVLMWIAASVAAASVTVRVVIAQVDPSSIHAQHGTDARVEAIAYGVVAAILIRWHSDGRVQWLRFLASPIWLLVGAAVFAGSSVIFNGGWTEPAFRPSVQALAAVIVLTSGLLMGTTDPFARIYFWLISLRPVQIVGLASYSIYLCHFVLIKAADPLLGTIPEPLAILANVALGLGIGIISYWSVERPMQRFKNLVGVRRSNG